jgi:hypothetical protein
VSSNSLIVGKHGVDELVHPGGGELLGADGGEITIHAEGGGDPDTQVEVGGAVLDHDAEQIVNVEYFVVLLRLLGLRVLRGRPSRRPVSTVEIGVEAVNGASDIPLRRHHWLDPHAGSRLDEVAGESVERVHHGEVKGVVQQ